MKHLDLFSGIGGFALACKWVGIETIGFVEIDKFCQQVLNKNFPNISIVGDIKDVKEDTFSRPVDIITGGFPCQPFSTAGKRRGSEDDRYLWPAMLNVIKEYKPTWILGENVTGIITMAFHQVLSDLENIGYETQAFIIPACAVDAMHKRDRVWFISHTQQNGSIMHNGTLGNQKTEILGGEEQLSPRVEVGDCNWWLPEPSVGRVVDGIPSKLDKDRVGALGNAIVPQIAYQILKGIKEYDRRN